MLPRLRSITFRCLFIIWTALISTAGCPLLLIPGRIGYNWSWIVGKAWAAGSLLLLRLVCRIDHRCRGGSLKQSAPQLYASKHQSVWETVFFLFALERPCFILKQQLVNIPVYGWYLRRMGMIAIVRNNGSEAIRKIGQQAKQRQQSGRDIVIFPEGTRTAYGTQGDCLPGVYLVYRMVGSCVPVALDSGKYWPKSGEMLHGTIDLMLHDPLPPGLSKEEFLPLLTERINDLPPIRPAE